MEMLKANIAAGTIYISQKGPLLLKSPQTTGMGEVSLGEKHFTGLKLRHLEKIAG